MSEEHMPAVFNGLNMQMPPRDECERTLQDLAWAEWWALHPGAPRSVFHEASVYVRLRSKPPTP